MRLASALKGVCCTPVCSFRGFLPRTHVVLAVCPIKIVSFHILRDRLGQSQSSCSLVRTFGLSTFRGSLFPRQSLSQQAGTRNLCVKKKQPLLLTMDASCANVSDDGSDVRETVSCPAENSVEIEDRQTETSTRSNTKAEEEKLQLTEHSGQSSDKVTGSKDIASEDSSRAIKCGLGEQAKTSQLSKRAQKKLRRKEMLKEQRKAKRAASFTKNSSPGFNSDLFSQTDYYFENGLRKVYPYHYTFSTYAKERWYGRTLQDIFEREFRVDSPDNFRMSVSKGFMRINGNVAKLDHVIKNGDLIEHDIHRHENPVSGTPIEILEDTEEVVVINKPASIPCHPCGKFRFNSIVFIMGKELGYANLRNIYRLDRLTSGVLIMGKTARKTKELENHVLHRRVHKEYVARVIGEFPPEEVTVDKPLDCLSHKLTLWRVVKKGGKPSRTTFQRLSYNGETSVVKCIPHTGRTHQIRVHLQYLGHPIVNDPYYNSSAWGPQRGKGGHCDVSFEELCQRIMTEHNVGLWCEGENPLFQERLAEAQHSQQPSVHNTDRTATEEEAGCDEDTDVPGMMESDERSEQHGDQLHPEGSPPVKKPRLGSVPPVPPSPADVAKSTVSDTDLLLQSSVPQSAASASINFTTETSVKAGHEPVPEADVSRASGPCEGSNCVSETEVKEDRSDLAAGGKEANLADRKRGTVERKGFDPDHWVPDPLCESCRLKYIDPQPHDLLLYLHALRYKGPGWDYMTKLPDWAAQDWQEPDAYSKYLH